jgi:hypothetical protein
MVLRCKDFADNFAEIFFTIKVSKHQPTVLDYIDDIEIFIGNNLNYKFNSRLFKDSEGSNVTLELNAIRSD